MGKGELTRRAILDHAVVVASRVGLGGLSVGTLAKATEMSKSGLYAHFGSAEQLELAVLAHAAEGFTDTVVRPALRTARGEPRLRELFTLWCANGISRQPACILFLRGAIELDDRVGSVRSAMVQLHRDMTETIAQVVRTAITEGHFRAEVDPEQFAQDLYGVVLSLSLAARLLEDPAAESRARRAFEALVAAARTTS